MEKIEVTWALANTAAMQGCINIMDTFKKPGKLLAYPVPRGGIYAALLIQRQMEVLCPDLKIELVENHELADLIIDDLVDSGKTRKRILDAAGQKPFFTLYDKIKFGVKAWYVFPWERMKNETGPEDAVTRLIEYIGDDPTREGLAETPARVVRSYSELFAGYKQNPADVMKFFEDTNCDEMVIVQPIKFYSTCEHHLLPVIGTAAVGYIPHGRVIGLSKLARVVDIFARRLQIQERLCNQITECIEEYLQPLGVGCVLKAQHLCMSARGVNKQDSEMITSSLRGAMRTDPKARDEFLSLTR